MRFSFLALALILWISSAHAGRLEDGTAALLSGNTQDALIYLQPLARMGDAHAQVALGILNEKSTGNYGQALSWYTKAADQGDPVAAWQIAMLYDNGKFAGHAPYNLGDALKADPNEAAKWVRKSADGGFPAAQAVLGTMYIDGYGDVKPDKAEADFWFSLAIASNGYTDLSTYGIAPGSVDTAHLKELAKVTRTDAEAGLSPAQLAAVQKRVKDWVPTAPAKH